MKRITYGLVFIALLFYGFCGIPDKRKLKTGDILFITSSSGQGKAIQLATKSKFTHVGVVFVENDKVYVYHAVEPVMKSTLDEFLQFSEDGKYTAKRLKKGLLLTDATNEKMRKMAVGLLGKHYDIYFNWKDDEWYCSEFVWKLYERNYHLQIGTLRPLKDFDLSSDVVKTVMKKRYGNNIPYDEKMISPQDMFDSPLLEEVVE
ncbi:MAG: YiiX family permuted papain-like enzyme [Bacteroidia bacterium]